MMQTWYEHQVQYCTRVVLYSVLVRTRTSASTGLEYSTSNRSSYPLVAAYQYQYDTKSGRGYKSCLSREVCGKDAFSVANSKPALCFAGNVSDFLSPKTVTMKIPFVSHERNGKSSSSQTRYSHKHNSQRISAALRADSNCHLYTYY